MKTDEKAIRHLFVILDEIKLDFASRDEQRRKGRLCNPTLQGE
jgi:hypothetical protein